MCIAVRDTREDKNIVNQADPEDDDRPWMTLSISRNVSKYLWKYIMYFELLR